MCLHNLTEERQRAENLTGKDVTTNKMYDLIYLENIDDYNRAKDDLLGVYANATFEDASDEVHRARFSVTIPDISDDAYRFKLLNLGMALCSLNFNIFMLESPKECRKL